MSDTGDNESTGEPYVGKMSEIEEQGAEMQQQEQEQQAAAATAAYLAAHEQVMAQQYGFSHAQHQHYWGSQGFQPGVVYQGYSVPQNQQHPEFAVQHDRHQHPGEPLGYQYPQHQQPMEGVTLPPGIPGLGGSTDPLEAVLGPFPCAQLRNLPYDATVEDILVLFQGLVVIDVVIVGQGDAFCVFANPMDFQMALQRSDRQTIGRRFVEIITATRAKYYGAISELHMRDQEGRASLSVGRASSEGENQQGEMPMWAAQQQGMPQSMPHHHHHHQPPQQQSQGGAGYGGEGLHGTPGGRMSGMSRSGGIHAPLQKRTGGGIQVGEHTGYLRMRGLPFSANKEDIFSFFGGYNPILDSIVLTYRNDGRATGESYVAFASPEDSKRAMDLHRRSMGSRYIELFISNKEEHGRALVRFGGR